MTSKPLTDDQRAQLKRDMPRDAVKTRSQAGQTLSYVDSVYVIDQLNEVFGYDGWSFTHEAPVIREGARPVVVVAGVLRAGGVERGDTGVGLAAGEKPDALETAVKAAVTDCLKRCARTWGARMGLALYDKQQEAVGWSFDAQEVIQAFDVSATHAEYEAARAKAAATWPRLPQDERDAVTAAQQRAKAHLNRVGSTDPNEAPPAQTATRPTVAPAPVASGAASEWMEAVLARIAEIELPGESVAVWMKYRGEAAKKSVDERETFWKALCKRTDEVGKMKDSARWLKACIAEEDERRGTAAPRPAAPKPSASVQLACDRVAVALSSRTVVAAILACDARGTAAAPLDAAVAARRAAGVDLGDVEAVLAKARTVQATPAQWEQSAAALAAFDAAADAATLNAARKAHAAAIVALPEALRSGVKSAADARAAALGAPTAASALVAKAKAAKTVKELDAINAELAAAVEARRVVTKADVASVTDALNARAAQLDSSAAEAA